MTFHVAMTIDEVLDVALEPAAAHKPHRGGVSSHTPQRAGRSPEASPLGVGWAGFTGGRVDTMTTITAPAEAIVEQVPKQLYIGGEWRDGEKGTLSVEDPSTGEVAVRGRRRVDRRRHRRAGRGRRAGPEWARTRRASAARSCAARSRRSSSAADELALLMTLEMGKPLAESQAEIVYAAEFLRWFSEEAVRIDGPLLGELEWRRGGC